MAEQEGDRKNCIDKAKLIEILTRLDFLKAFTAIGTVLVDEIGLPEAEFPYTLTKKDYKILLSDKTSTYSNILSQSC